MRMRTPASSDEVSEVEKRYFSQKFNKKFKTQKFKTPNKVLGEAEMVVRYGYVTTRTDLNEYARSSNA